MNTPLTGGMIIFHAPMISSLNLFSLEEKFLPLPGGCYRNNAKNNHCLDHICFLIPPVGYQYEF